jgi:hypothetical protein
MLLSQLFSFHAFALLPGVGTPRQKARKLVTTPILDIAITNPETPSTKTPTVNGASPSLPDSGKKKESAEIEESHGKRKPAREAGRALAFGYPEA